MHAANDPVAAVRPHLPIMAVNKSTSLHRIIDHANDVIGVRVVCVESIISYLRSVNNSDRFRYKLELCHKVPTRSRLTAALSGFFSFNQSTDRPDL